MFCLINGLSWSQKVENSFDPGYLILKLSAVLGVRIRIAARIEAKFRDYW